VPLCQAEAQRCQTCGGSSTPLTACQRANFTAYCDDVANALSPTYANGFVACASNCDQDAANNCLQAYVADAAPTSAQLKAATDFCAVCGQDD
jgi:hypothetical protein